MKAIADMTLEELKSLKTDVEDRLFTVNLQLIPTHTSYITTMLQTMVTILETQLILINELIRQRKKINE